MCSEGWGTALSTPLSPFAIANYLHISLPVNVTACISLRPKSPQWGLAGSPGVLSVKMTLTTTYTQRQPITNSICALCVPGAYTRTLPTSCSSFSFTRCVDYMFLIPELSLICPPHPLCPSTACSPHSLGHWFRFPPVACPL